MSPTEAARVGVKALLAVMHKEVRGMHQAAYLLACVAFLSQLLALVRDRLLAASFGASPELDLYYAAFRVPDLLFATVASLLSLYALLPILSTLERDEKGASFLSHLLLWFFAAMGVLAAVLYVFAPFLASVVAPGIANADLVALMRILLLQPILLGASNILASLTQLRNRFVLYSISPLLYNIGIILGIVFFYPEMGLSGLAWGVVLGALLHVLIQAPFFFMERGKNISATETVRYTKSVLALSIPRTLSLSMGQFSLLILTALASFFAPGSIAVFTFAFNLQAVPLAIIGVSYSVAAFPTLSRLHAAGEKGEFLKHVEAALRHVLFWAIPATVLIIVLRAQLVRTILGAGAFDWEATRLTAAALALFVVSLCAQSVVLLLSRAYYAAGETWRPLQAAMYAVITAVGSAFLLTTLFHSSILWRNFLEMLLRVSDIPGTTVLMLALGYALGALMQATALLYWFAKDFSFSVRGVGRLVFESFGASVIGGAAAYIALSYAGSLLDINTTVGVVLQGTIGGLTGITVAVCVLYLLRNRELIETYSSLHRSIRRSPPVVEVSEVA